MPNPRPSLTSNAFHHLAILYARAIFFWFLTAHQENVWIFFTFGSIIRRRPLRWVVFPHHMMQQLPPPLFDALQQTDGSASSDFYFFNYNHSNQYELSQIQKTVAV